MIDFGDVNVALLKEPFKTRVITLLTNSPYHWRLIYGYRSLLEQNALYVKYLQGGPLAAPPGKSAHNYGLAVDVVLLTLDKNGVWQEDWNYLSIGWSWLWIAVFKAVGLHSGKLFGDPDHIQDNHWILNRYATS